LRQHRHGRVVTVEPLRGHHVSLDEAAQRIERRADGAHGVDHSRQRDRRALQRVPLGLSVQRLMLAELLEHDHRQQARSSPSPRDRMKRGRRLADLLAVPAGELLPHGLDHFPTSRLGFHRPRHVFAELAQSAAAAAFANRRRINHHALARQMIGKRVALDRAGACLRQLGRGGFRVQILARARQALRLFLSDQDVVWVMTVFRLRCGERLGPALSGSAAGAACIERLLELVGVG
jgi:hypothetical protein